MEVGPLVRVGEINAVLLGGAPSKALRLKNLRTAVACISMVRPRNR